jgi:molybdate/tungstate transport system permease protein
MKLNNYGNFSLVMILMGGLVLLFILSPLISIFLHTSFPSLHETLGDSHVTRSIGLTLWTSMLGTILLSLGAIPLAYMLARKQFPLKNFVQGIIDLPVVIPHSAAGIAILGLISRDSIIGKTASVLGLELVGHPAGIIIAMAFVSVPFMINAARDGFAEVPERIEKAALSMGASPLKVFFTISLPLAWRSIISGFILMFARGMSEFGAVVIIAYHPMITPVLIYERFGAFGLNYARPVAAIFIIVSLFFFVLLRMMVKEKNNNA